MSDCSLTRLLGVWSKWRQTKTATPKQQQNWHGQLKTAISQNGDKPKQRKSKRRQELCVVKLLMKHTMIYSLCTGLSYVKRHVIDVMCNELL